jgi:ribosomal protein S6--L-glutamate ligase
MVMEVNSSPGLEGIQKATGVDVAGAIIELMEKEGTPSSSSAGQAPEE